MGGKRFVRGDIITVSRLFKARVTQKSINNSTFFYVIVHRINIYIMPSGGPYSKPLYYKHECFDAESFILERFIVKKRTENITYPGWKHNYYVLFYNS